MSLTAKHMKAILKTQYDEKVASNTEKAVVAAQFEAALSRQALDIGFQVEDLPLDASEDEGIESEMSGVEDMD